MYAGSSERGRGEKTPEVDDAFSRFFFQFSTFLLSFLILFYSVQQWF